MQSFILDQVLFVESADDENKKFNEEDIYNKILHQLEPTQKWGDDQSDKYLKRTKNVYKDQLKLVKDELQDVMAKLKSEMLRSDKDRVKPSVEKQPPRQQEPSSLLAPRAPPS